MQRQKSILSFFQKPSLAGNQKSGTGEAFNERKEAPQFTSKQYNNQNVTAPSEPEIQGIDTPPEKVPRQILPSRFAENDSVRGSSLFSSIMHKFVKVDDKEKSTERRQASDTTNTVSGRVTNLTGLSKQEASRTYHETGNFCNSNGIVDVESNDDDVPGPETPGVQVQPLVPRLKRIHQDIPKFNDGDDNSLSSASKRVKLLLESTALSKNQGQGQVSESTSKFEWLDPLRIRDANGRRPNDPLFDKKTLYIEPDVLKKMSASQKQYWSVKSQYMDVVLFFKVGKFYELYELDAEIGHKELDWKITFSGVGKCRQVGISENGIDDAVEKLVARGYKVGRIEQCETSDQAKARGANSVIARKLVQVVTPSTTSDGNIGPDAVHLLAINEGNIGLDNGASAYGFAFVDCASLKFWVGSIGDDSSCATLGALLMQVSPKEVIYESKGMSRETQKALRKYLLTSSTASQLNPVPLSANILNASEVRNLIQSKGYFRGSSNPLNNTFDSIVHHDIALNALGGLVDHLSRLMLDDVLRNGEILPYHVYGGCLRIDGQTLVNLEIFNNNFDGGLSGTLFSYLDNCVTSSGKRLLRKWICHPLKSVEGINNRLNVVEDLMTNSEIMLIISQYLCKIPDIERMLGRVKSSFQASASLALPLIGKKLLKQRVKVFGSLVKGLRTGMDLLLLLQKNDQLFSLLSNIFKLPELHGSAGLEKFLSQVVAAVDSEFPNFQNHDVTDSEAETLSVLIELFIEKATQWSEVIHAINCIDVLRSFAITASLSSGSMSRPVILPESKTTIFGQDKGGPVLKIKGLWHPFALAASGGVPVPNDLYLGEDIHGYHPRTLLLTGPNMGGKSTLLRATCLAVILAQLGCFVPSEKCILSLVDVIFTRLGATDRIMTGESTFFVECTETASVLQNATQDSVVILDELGRGTSTFDGYAIAYAVFRHLVEKVNCRLLFATHYHPLTKEFASHPHVTLQHMACAFKSKSESNSKGDQDLVFLYRLASGACPGSYGLQVAIMAGIPENVVKRASMARQVMKKSIGESFKLSEKRSEFSTLHEDWLKTLLSTAQTGDCNVDDNDDDVYDTLFCLWHELKSAYQSNN
ncbi:DNA mismatch repair protein MSH7 isoform X2 [Mercurialis annua]|uniref:DNA mismatch repair protein MSH7 isoform X2 n=1 Tax=Mercurialis annua TaxID=3986 RepID=UPI00215FAA7C|nr:DNA mismatch repair protein MSH7 isoform X2 [Mercurialis annua]